MARTWAVGRKIGVGFGAVVALTMFVAAIGVLGLRRVVAEEDRLVSYHAEKVQQAQALATVFERKVAEFRGYCFTRDDRLLGLTREARAEFDVGVERLGGLLATPAGKQLLAEIVKAEAEHQEGLERAIALLRDRQNSDTVARMMREDLAPRREQLHQRLAEFVAMEDRLLDEAKATAAGHAADAQRWALLAALAATALAIAVAFAIGRAISRQVGGAIQHVQGSSTELRTAATQQVTGAKEQSGAMTQIATTINELLTTSRQIADSAKRVAAIAEKTATSGRAGEESMQAAVDSVTTIKRQVDNVVTYMLDLGKRSQQIGGVLEIINELAEQTNILAINATIEAAGANESGRRFGVVADEIRKLADRVSGSTKEIRGLIDEVRSAVTTTVMATEGGSKAVDAGVHQFERVAASFKDIVTLVGTTTEAAREIELSTKQQASAVEQVNVAISDVAQTTRETEASSAQMLQTASQLSGLATDLMRLVQPPASA